MKRFIAVLFVTCGFFSGVWAQAGPQEPLNIGNRLEPFVDNFLIDRMDGAALRLDRPAPSETVLRFDKPWEGRYSGYLTIIHDDGRYRLYYRGLPESRADGSDLETTCYAESADGIHFEKPSLGIFEVSGTRENNVVLANRAPLSHNFAPFLDDRPGVPPAERYKALAGLSTSGLVAFVSPDGLHWNTLCEEPVLREGDFDSQNVAFWSNQEQLYLCYLRKSSADKFRWVSRSESKDFLHWSKPVQMDKGSAPSEHIYTNQTAPYFRAPHLYISTAARFMPGRRAITAEEGKRIGIEAEYAGDCSDNVLMTSRGGYRYDRTFLEALVRPEIGPENWTSRTNYPARGVVQTGSNEMSFYIQHNYGQTTGFVRRYALRLDGFAAITAPYAGGEWVSKPLIFDGSALYLNFATSAAGGIRVELRDPQGQPLPGFALQDCDEAIGNAIARRVTWKGSAALDSLKGKPVCLRMSMKDASLYAIQFR